jgi:methyl-accepting chemotaxis protein
VDLGNFRISTKVFGVVGLLAAVSVVITSVGVSSMSELNGATDEMAVASRELAQGAKLRSSVMHINRAEFLLAADPSSETIREAKSTIEQRRPEIEESLKAAQTTASAEQARLLGDVKISWDKYKEEVLSTVQTAEKQGANVSIGEAQRLVLNEAMASRNVARQLEEAVERYVEHTDKDAQQLSARATDTYSHDSLVMMLVAGLGVVAGLGLAWIVSQSGVVKPIRRIVEALGRLAKGDLDVEVYGADRKDEVGDIAKTMQVFKDTALEARRMAADEAEARAERERRAAKVDELTRDFDKAVSGVLESVASATNELQATAGSMSATAEETSRQSVAVAAASEQASSNVQTVASAAEELSASIGEISRQVQQSAQVAGKAAEDASRTNGTVKSLAEAAQKIGEVVNLINDIASQTNLLALNATIEAARAGEAGKGFAVVASEVKSLANQTAKATEEIGAQISAMQSVTGEAVGAISAIGTTIGEINQIATAIASAVEEQGAATQEIARNVQQAAAGTQQVSANIAGVQQAASDTGAASQQVLGASGELARQSETLRRQVDDFLAGVKAA